MTPAPPHRRVSDAVRPPRFGAFGREVRRALRWIDAVHRDGALPTLPLRPLAAPLAGETHGAYWHGGYALPSIEVWRGSPSLWLVCIHEVGHLLDGAGFGLPPGQFASESSPLLQPWRDAVATTRVYARLSSLLALPRYRETDAHGRPHLVCYEEVTLANGVTIERPVDVELVRYAATWRELFARSYVQYIVHERNDARLREQFVRLRVDERVVLHWDDDDFALVRDALDDLMHRIGWR